jgi:tight adherence protein B
VSALVAAMSSAIVVASIMRPTADVTMLRRQVARRHKARRQASDVARAWPDVLRDVLVGVRSGLPLEQSIIRAARTAPAPLAEALGRFGSLSASMGPVQALESIRSGLADPVSDRVTEILKVGIERGGALPVSLLDDLADSVSEDLALAEEIDAAALEFRVNAAVVAVLPWLVLGALIWGGGPYRDFYESVPGLAVIVLGAVATGLGSWAVVRLGRIPSEIRIVRDPGDGR